MVDWYLKVLVNIKCESFLDKPFEVSIFLHLIGIICIYRIHLNNDISIMVDV